MTNKPYTREQPTEAELQAAVIEKQKQIEESNAHARETIKQSAISAAKGEAELRGEAVYEVRLPDQIGE